MSNVTCAGYEKGNFCAQIRRTKHTIPWLRYVQRTRARSLSPLVQYTMVQWYNGSDFFYYAKCANRFDFRTCEYLTRVLQQEIRPLPDWRVCGICRVQLHDSILNCLPCLHDSRLVHHVGELRAVSFLGRATNIYVVYM